MKRLFATLLTALAIGISGGASNTWAADDKPAAPAATAPAAAAPAAAPAAAAPCRGSSASCGDTPGEVPLTGVIVLWPGARSGIIVVDWRVP